MARARTGTLELRKGVWHARVTVDVEGGQERRWFTLGTSNRTMASTRLKKLVKDIAAGKTSVQAATSTSAAETVKDYASGAEARMSDDDRRNLRLHAFRSIGPMLVGDVESQHVKSALTEAIEEGLKHESVRKLLGAMRRLFALAVEDQIIETNPAATVKIPKQRGADREVHKEREILRDDEFSALMACPDVDEELRMMSLVARVEGGMRTGDVNRWDWAMVDRVHFAACHVSRSKTAKQQALEVPDVLRPFLRAWWERSGKRESGPIFPARRGKNAGGFKATRGISYAERLRKALVKALRWAGIAPRRELFEETATTLPVDFHSFRRSFNTALGEAGVNMQTAMHLAGHSDAKTHLRYVMAGSAAKRIPAAALPVLTLPPAAQSPQRQGDSDDSLSEIAARHSGFEPLAFGFGVKRAASESDHLSAFEPGSEGPRGLHDPVLEPHVSGESAESSSIVPAPEDPDAALALAIGKAAEAGRFDLVSTLAAVLRDRQLARTGVVDLAAERRKREG